MTEIVIDGSCGAGKTAILFGRGHEDPEDIRYDCLVERGYQVLPETVLIVANQMAKEGKCLTANSEEWINRIIKKEEERYVLRKNSCGLYIFERGLPGYIVFEEAFQLKLPPVFYDLCQTMQYSEPIILLEPVTDYDISQPRPGQHKERTFTLEQRQKMHQQVRDFYAQLGYEVAEIPYNPTDLQNTTPRIEKIIELIQ